MELNANTNLNSLFHYVKKSNDNQNPGSSGLYDRKPMIENLNLCFTVNVPVQQSFVIFNLIQTSLILGHHIPNQDTVIEWRNKVHTSWQIKIFPSWKEGNVKS